jgi:hypothetical protein
MKARYLILVLTIVIFSLETKGQDSIKANYIITFTPVTLINPINPAFQIGLEKRLTDNSRIYSDLGILLPYVINSYDSAKTPSYKGFRILIGYKYYRNWINEFNGFYIAPELFFLHNRYTEILSFNKPTDSIKYHADYYDKVNILRETFGLNIKIGNEFKMNRFIFDVYGGLGFKHRLVVHFDRTNINDDMTSPIDLNIRYLADKPANEWTLNLTLGFKIGYIIK